MKTTQIMLLALVASCLCSCQSAGSQKTQGKNQSELPHIGLFTVASKMISPAIQCSGQIQPETGKEATVSSRLPGRLIRLDAALGQHVTKGQIVAWVESKDIADLQAEVVEALARLKIAQAHEARERCVYEEELIRPHGLIGARTTCEQAKVAFDLANEDYKRTQSLYEQKIAAAREFISAKANLEKTRLAYEESKAEQTREEKLFANKAIIRKDLDLARAETRKCQQHLDTLKGRLKLLGVPIDHLQQIMQGGELIAHTPIRAPFAGEVVELTTAPGETVAPDKPLMRICDLSTVVIASAVPEADAAALTPGVPVTATVQALPGIELKGNISYISSLVDPDTRTIAVRSRIPNADQKLKLNMFTTIAIAGKPREATVCPLSAVHHEGEVTNVYIEQDGKYLKRPIQTGATIGDCIEIKAGLNPGERVVTEGSVLIKTELSFEGQHD